MGPKRKVVTHLVLAGLTALAISTGAEGAFLTYSASGTNVSSSFVTSAPLDLGGEFPSLIIDATLGLTVSSLLAATISTSSEGLQTVQSCAFAPGLCGAGDWIDLTGLGLSVGGTSFTQTTTPTETKSFGSGPVSVSGVGIQSLRLKWDASTISPPSSVGATGSLLVTAIPEPGTWALVMAGILGIVGIARRRMG